MKVDSILHRKKMGMSVVGQKFFVERVTVPQIMSSTMDHKFTFLPFNSASGDAVCCAIISQGKGDVPLGELVLITASLQF